MKAIRLSAHAQGYLQRRGFTAAEVEEAIRTGNRQPAELGRQECQKDFLYGRDWNGKVYQTKRVRPVFVEESNEIVRGDGLHVLFLATMKISYDPEVDALSIVFRETTVTTKHLAEGIAGEYDSDGRLAGLEVLDAIKRFGDADTLRQVVLEGVGPSASMLQEKPDQKYGG